MGIFGFVKKAVGKVVKTGLSVATRGVSDKVLKGLKQLGQAKQAAKAAAANEITLQRYAQMAKVAPKVAITKAPAAVKLALRPMGAPKPKAKKRRKAAAAPRAKSTSGRKPPKGGLDLAAIGRAWRAAGKPGSWQAYIKANPIKKK